MTATAINLAANVNMIDFTSMLTPVWNNDVLLDLGNGIMGLYAGDVIANNSIDAADRSEAWNLRNQSGYLQTDVNLDGTCSASDRSIIWNNRNKLGLLP